MSDDQSIFHDDWRDCLQAHYAYVIRINDRVTEPTLHAVLLRVGFSEAEIQELAIRAKMRDTEAPLQDLPGLE